MPEKDKPKEMDGKRRKADDIQREANA